MKLSGHIEVIRTAIDTMTDEHPVGRGAWLALSDLLHAVDQFERDVHRMEFVEGENRGNHTDSRHGMENH